MKKVIRLTEADLTRIVRRVIKEQEGGSDPQDPAHHFNTVEKALIPKGFKKDISMLKAMGSEDLINGGGHGGIIVRYYSPVHPESKKKGYVVELIVNNASKKKWGNDVNMYEVIKEVEKYLKPKGVNESRIGRRVINESLSTDLLKLGFEKWDKGYILRLPKGSTPKNDIIRITAQHVTGPDKFLVSVMVNGNAKMRSEVKNGITVFRDVQNTFGSKLIRQDDKFESVSGEITGYELEKLVKKLLSLKYDPKNNIFTIG